jgi:hypothetical protein
MTVKVQFPGGSQTMAVSSEDTLAELKAKLMEKITKKGADKGMGPIDSYSLMVGRTPQPQPHLTLSHSHTHFIIALALRMCMLYWTMVQSHTLATEFIFTHLFSFSPRGVLIRRQVQESGTLLPTETITLNDVLLLENHSIQKLLVLSLKPKGCVAIPNFHFFSPQKGILSFYCFGKLLSKFFFFNFPMERGKAKKKKQTKQRLLIQFFVVCYGLCSGTQV